MTSQSTSPSNYEAAVAELEQIVAQMESGELTLDASLSAYQRGAQLVKQCRQQLDSAQQQVQVLESEMLTTFQQDEGEASDVN